MKEDICELELASRINKQHIVSCWVAIIVNTLWSLFNYFVFFENQSIYLFAGGGISCAILLAVLYRKKLRISPGMLGMIPMVLMSVFFSYTYSQLNLQQFQQFTIIYVAMFLGAGMFLLWKIKYSVITVLGTLIANVVFFKLFNSLTFNEIMLNGGILTLSMAFFMIVSIQIRYNLVLKGICSKVALMKTQDEIKKSDAQSRLLFNKNPRPMLIYSIDNLSILDVNDTMVEKYGYTKDEFLKMKITELRPKDEVEKVMQDVENVKNGIEKVSEWSHKLKNGEIIDVEISAKTIEYSGEKARLVLIKDITKSKIIQEQLKESEKEHRLFFENNPIPMFVFSEKTHKIVEVNKTMEIKYGYSNEDFFNLHLINEPLYKSICEIIKSGNNVENEYSHVIKSGNFIIVKAKTTDIKFKTEPAKLVSLNDITKIKLNEMALEDAKRLALKAKKYQSQFLSNMSHEIRTPMNGILGMTRLLRKTKLTKDQEKYTKAIFTSADNLMVIINEILDFSKIEAGKLTIEHIPFNLKELAHIWEETLKLRADDNNISFNINIDADVPNNLIGDPIRLNQVIYNLAGNAIKFTKKGEVNINIYTVKTKQDKVDIQFDVKDSGIGIPSDKLEKIFSSFSQASTSTTREYGGTGLGLTITKQLIELQDGEVWVESELGEGSTFSFVLTYNIQERDISQSIYSDEFENNTESPIAGLNVLLVEDHDINQMLATTVLEGWDFKVDLAENGLEAIEKVANENYDVILMDIHMPKMDGYEATKQIRKKLKNNTPVIAMTASAKIGDNKKCFEVGMDDYITKPFDPELLLEKITRQIKKK
jgi:PAS domain S-box-containing protein